jgi:hypothetical protein
MLDAGSQQEDRMTHHTLNRQSASRSIRKGRAIVRAFAGSALPVLATALAAHAQTPRTAIADTATMIVRLGTDTVAVERWLRTGDRLDVLHVGRSPNVTERRYSLRFDGDGRVTHVATATGDGALQERAVQPVGAVPVFSSLYAPYAVMLDAAWRAGVGQLDVPMQAGPNLRQVPVRRTAGGVYEIPNQFGALMTARLDTQGRVLAIDAGGGATVERVPALNLDVLAADWRARDARGDGIGPLSPRVTVDGSVAGARISVAYGRPAARGRVVMGNLVPYGEVWRTGANEETVLTVGQPIQLGTLRLEAGTYSLFTVPGPQDWELIVSRQTGQGGLGYDPAHDVGRVRMQQRALDQPVERFTIGIREELERGTLTMSWEHVEVSVPILVLAR